jgi:2-amino-4-hydroxy-6-hydroxymethyldihydropteridine diphosphokinase
VTVTYIGIGSNLNDPVRQVRRAIDALRSLGELVIVSSLYRTKPWGKTDQPAFVNAVVGLATDLQPRTLLFALKALERELGRSQIAERWGPRLIDFDILTYGDQTLHLRDLRVPHPRLRQRAFVLVPLAEIAPQYVPLRDALPAEQLATVEAIAQR